MKTFIVNIYGGGTPLYLISAENEQRAWSIVREALSKRGYNHSFNPKKDSNGLIEVEGWYANDERIVDIHELYSTNGITKKGSFDNSLAESFKGTGYSRIVELL